MCVQQTLKDCIPILSGRYKPYDASKDMLSAREEALHVRVRHMQAMVQWIRTHMETTSPGCQGPGAHLELRRPQTLWAGQGRASD